MVLEYNNSLRKTTRGGKTLTQGERRFLIGNSSYKGEES